MLAQRYRFHGYGSLKSAYRAGKNVRGSLISLKYTTSSASRRYRVAVVVSKKVHKSAVVRNRIRRRLYELVRLSEFQAPAGTDLVFTVFSDQVATVGADVLKRQVDELLRKALVDHAPA